MHRRCSPRAAGETRLLEGAPAHAGHTCWVCGFRSHQRGTRHTKNLLTHRRGIRAVPGAPGHAGGYNAPPAPAGEMRFWRRQLLPHTRGRHEAKQLAHPTPAGETVVSNTPPVPTGESRLWADRSSRTRRGHELVETLLPHARGSRSCPYAHRTARRVHGCSRTIEAGMRPLRSSRAGRGGSRICLAAPALAGQGRNRELLPMDGADALDAAPKERGRPSSKSWLHPHTRGR